MSRLIGSIDWITPARVRQLGQGPTIAKTPKMSKMLLQLLLAALGGARALQDEAWSGAWNVSAGFKTGLSLVALDGLRITPHPTSGSAGAAGTGASVNVAREWGGVAVPDALVAPSAGRIPSRLWHPNIYLGVEYDTSFAGSATTVLSRTATALALRRTVRLATQQGWVEAAETHTFAVSGGLLRYTMTSDKPNATAVFEFLRPGATPATAVVAAPADEAASPLASTPPAQRRATTAAAAAAAADPAYHVILNDTWSIADGGVDENLLLLSLQGLANRGDRKLYLLQPIVKHNPKTGAN